VNAYGSVVAWSSHDPQTKQFFLTARVGGQSKNLPVKPSKQAFDADVGPGPDGSIWIVYSRCSKTQRPAGTARRSCELFRYSFKEGNEARLPGTPSRASETQPSIWGHRVAFVRAGGAIEHTYVRDLNHPARVHRQPGPPNGRCPKSFPHCVAKFFQTVHDLDLHGRYLAILTDDNGGDCTDNRPQISLVGNGANKLIATSCPGEGEQNWLGLSFDRGSLYFMRTCSEGCKAGTYAYDLATGKYTFAPAAQTEVNSFARAVGHSYYVLGSLFQVDGLRFQRAAVKH